MFNYILIITAQYCENYLACNEDWDGKATAWKNKGGAEFKVTVSSDMRMAMDNDDLEMIIDKLLAEKSNLHTKYERVDYDFASEEPTDITTDFMKEYNLKFVN